MTDAEILALVLERGTNSSHFLWLFGRYEYFRSANDWIFAFQKRNGIALLVFEPLCPVSIKPNEFKSELAIAWREFIDSQKIESVLCVGIMRPFLEALQDFQPQALIVGREPWIELERFKPSGKSGHGVRAGRNQALRIGLYVEEWSGSDIAQPAQAAIVRELLKEWRDRSLLQMDGFILATDPLRYTEQRRYFVVRSKDVVYALLVASPMREAKNYLFEDILFRPDAPRGVTELLLFEAIGTLNASGIKSVSLGVVTLAILAPDKKFPPIPALKNMLPFFQRALWFFYNAQGIELYRKRFKPHAWTETFVALVPGTNPSITGRTWLRAVAMVIAAYKPRLNLSWKALVLPLQGFKRHPFSLGLLSIQSLLFCFVNKGGALPDWAKESFGFQLNTSHPLLWLAKSFFSNFFYWDFSHFFYVTTLLTVVLFSLEKLYRRTFLFGVVLGSFILSDLINYLIVIRPLHYFHQPIFENLLRNTDVGSSLLLMTLLGLRIFCLRRYREPVFVISSLALVLVIAFTSLRFHNLFFNMNHWLSFIAGYAIGYFALEAERRRSRAEQLKKTT